MMTEGGKESNAQYLQYSKVREQIRTGDVFLFRGHSALSRFIRWGSKSPYSHAGMAAWWGKRLAVFQAVGRGVEFVPMSVAVDKYDGQVDWWSLAPQFDGALDREKIVDGAITELGKEYGSASLVRLVLRMLAQRFRGTPDAKAHPSTLFCSQYVSYCYRTAGLDLRPDTADECTSPGDLATSGRLLHRGVLHRHGQAEPEPEEERAITENEARA
jgi:hypothetical protein